VQEPEILEPSGPVFIAGSIDLDLPSAAQTASGPIQSPPSPALNTTNQSPFQNLPAFLADDEDSDIEDDSLLEPDSDSEDEESAPPTVEADAEAETKETEIQIRQAHTRLASFISRDLKKLRKKSTVQTDAKASDRLLQLTALKNYNDLVLHSKLKKYKLRASLKGCARSMRPKLKARMRSIRPTIEASETVAYQCGKTSYFARKLRSTALEYSRTGVLPETSQGKGAYHKSLLDLPAVRNGVKEWFKGDLEFEKGGFKGRVRDRVMYLDESLTSDLPDATRKASTIRERVPASLFGDRRHYLPKHFDSMAPKVWVYS
jgi:hypothetical protein